MSNLDKQDTLIFDIATLTVIGKGPYEIAKQLNVDARRVKRIQEKPECKEAIKEITNSAITNAKNVVKSEVSKMVPALLETLKKHLEEHNLNAVPHALKILGITEDEKGPASTKIQVIIPGEPTQPKTIEGEVIDAVQNNED